VEACLRQLACLSDNDGNALAKLGYVMCNEPFRLKTSLYRSALNVLLKIPRSDWVEGLEEAAKEACGRLYFMDGWENYL
jgi:hypothetical protein